MRSGGTFGAAFVRRPCFGVGACRVRCGASLWVGAPAGAPGRGRSRLARTAAGRTPGTEGYTYHSDHKHVQLLYACSPPRSQGVFFRGHSCEVPEFSGKMVRTGVDLDVPELRIAVEAPHLSLHAFLLGVCLGSSQPLWPYPGRLVGSPPDVALSPFLPWTAAGPRARAVRVRQVDRSEEQTWINKVLWGWRSALPC